MEIKYLQHISATLNLGIKPVMNILELHDGGSTIPFIARYRKEATGNLDEVAIANVIEQIKYFNELEKRKETVIKTIEDAGKMTPELKKRIEDTVNATELEDIYLPYKPKRKTKASVAIEKGLEPLAKLLFDQESISVEEEAAKYINEQVKDKEEALQGARDIMAEWVSENEQARNIVRKLFTEDASVLFPRAHFQKRRSRSAEIP
jgi:uncharacterized protein